MSDAADPLTLSLAASALLAALGLAGLLGYVWGLAIEAQKARPRDAAGGTAKGEA